MGLKTVGTLPWEACKSCKHEMGGKCFPFFDPEFHRSRDDNKVICADYLSRVESEE